MEEINFGSLIEEVLVTFNRNRMGIKPRIFVTIPPGIPLILWHDNGLERCLRAFLYDTLLMSNPEMPLQIAVHTRTRLKDLEEFVGVEPLCWIQVRIAGYGLRMRERMIEDRFKEQSYRCEEWVGVEDSEAQLAIFRPDDRNEMKMVFCMDSTSSMRKCDLLIPVPERALLVDLASQQKGS